jgi:hypothetical protein
MQSHEAHLIEWSASVTCTDGDGDDVILTAYYYTEHDELIDDDGEPLDDLSNVNWVIDHYTVL